MWQLSCRVHKIFHGHFKRKQPLSRTFSAKCSVCRTHLITFQLMCHGHAANSMSQLHRHPNQNQMKDELHKSIMETSLQKNQKHCSIFCQANWNHREAKIWKQTQAKQQPSWKSAHWVHYSHFTLNQSVNHWLQDNKQAVWGAFLLGLCMYTVTDDDCRDELEWHRHWNKNETQEGHSAACVSVCFYTSVCDYLCVCVW